MKNESAQSKGGALVTGATTGIGLELAKLLARDGHPLILVARNAKRLQEVSDALRRDYHVDVSIFARDLAEPGTAQELFSAVEKTGAEVEILINNAGFGVYGEFSKSPLEDELGMIELNISALTVLTKLFLPRMLRFGRGKIMNVSSTAAFQPGPLMSVYYATKAYVLFFSEALAEELRGTGVSVTTLCPGATVTEFQSRAAMGNIALFKYNAMSAESVARIGYRGMLRGKRIVVTGGFNRFGAFAVRFAPRGLVTRIVKKVMS